VDASSERSVDSESPSRSASLADSDTPGLECLVGKARIALPVSAIAQIVEYDLIGDAPLLGRFIGGFAMYEQRVLVSIALSQREEGTSGRRRTRAILLAAHSVSGKDGSGGIGWGFEVTEVRRFVRVTTREHPRTPGQKPFPPWVSVRETTDGRALGWIDVATMLAELRDER
jgi:chemotaxis signal transduction protein